ncbi:hypothetical protein NHX12_020131, partial [Muraenolepis orangiensis]
TQESDTTTTTGPSSWSSPACRSRTYGLCAAFKRGVDSNNSDDEDDATPPHEAFTPSESMVHGAQEVRQQQNGNSSVFSHGLGPSHSCVMGQVPQTANDLSFANCPSTPVATPVIQYDGSEEELMDTIEREFS